MVRLQPYDALLVVALPLVGWLAKRARIWPLGFNWPLGADGRRVRGMQLGPTDLREPAWKICKERVWAAPVRLDSSTEPQRSTMSTRLIGAVDGSRESFSAHIIPLCSTVEAEALAVTLLERKRRDSDSEVKVVSQRSLDWINLEGASNVRAVERQTTILGRDGRMLTLAGTVGSVAFGIEYVCFGANGWAHDRFMCVAQSQADKIRSQLRTKAGAPER